MCALAWRDGGSGGRGRSGSGRGLAMGFTVDVSVPRVAAGGRARVTVAMTVTVRRSGRGRGGCRRSRWEGVGFGTALAGGVRVFADLPRRSITVRSPARWGPASRGLLGQAFAISMAKRSRHGEAGAAERQEQHRGANQLP